MKGKITKGTCLALGLICAAGTLAGCVEINAVSVTSIEKTASEGLVDTYTIYYSNGTTSTFEVTNGKDGVNGTDGKDGIDGKDGADGLDGEDGADGEDGEDGSDGKDGAPGKDLTAQELYENYCAVYGEISYAQFLDLFLTVNTDDSAIIGKCLQSTVKIYSEFTETDATAAGGTKQAAYTGAGVIYRIDSDYTYILTNYHVVYDQDAAVDHISQTIHCYLYGSESMPSKKTTDGTVTYEYDSYAIPCEYVGGAVNYDVAVIRAKTQEVYAINPNVYEAEFAEGYAVGQTAFTVGNPGGDGLSATKGIVSVDSEMISLDIDGTLREYRSVRIDTAIYKGSSGGGLFDVNGKLIGLVNAGRVTDQNINFAIPLPIVKGVAVNVLFYFSDENDETEGVCSIASGMTVVSQNSRYVYNSVTKIGSIVEECVVGDVEQGGIAETLKLAKGDVLSALLIDGEEYPLTRQYELDDLLLTVRPGAQIAYRYVRAGEAKTTAAYTVLAEDLNQIA